MLKSYSSLFSEKIGNLFEIEEKFCLFSCSFSILCWEFCSIFVFFLKTDFFFGNLFFIEVFNVLFDSVFILFELVFILPFVLLWVVIFDVVNIFKLVLFKGLEYFFE
jgi:hypothetical protein